MDARSPAKSYLLRTTQSQGLVGDENESCYLARIGAGCFIYILSYGIATASLWQ